MSFNLHSLMLELVISVTIDNLDLQQIPTGFKMCYEMSIQTKQWQSYSAENNIGVAKMIRFVLGLL